MTMEQLAREGAQQAMISGAIGSDEDDTTGISDLNSLQNFSYYGRGFNDRNRRMQESPVASDAVSMTNPTFAVASMAGNVRQQPHKKVVRKESGMGNDISADTMSENVSNFTGFYNK